MTPVAVGIIGCGNIAPAYVAGCNLFPETLQLSTVADRDTERAAAFAKAHNLHLLTVEQLLIAPDIGVIINLTPPTAHFDVSMAIIAAGKMLYSEKPLGITVEQGQQILAAAQEADVQVGCAPDTFLGAGGQTSRAVIDQGLIGKPVAGVAFFASHGPESWHPSPGFFYTEGGGPLLDMGPYYVTSLVNLLGPVKRVAGLTGKGLSERVSGHETIRGQKIPVTVDTHYAGLLEFHSGAVVTLIASFDVWAHSLPRIEIYGTGGTLRVPDPNRFDGMVEVFTPDKDWHEIAHRQRANIKRGVGLADMVRQIRQGEQHRASGTLALHVLEVMQAVTTASVSGRTADIESRPAQPPALPRPMGNTAC